MPNPFESNTFPMNNQNVGFPMGNDYGFPREQNNNNNYSGSNNNNYFNIFNFPNLGGNNDNNFNPYTDGDNNNNFSNKNNINFNRNNFDFNKKNKYSDYNSNPVVLYETWKRKVKTYIILKK